MHVCEPEGSVMEFEEHNTKLECTFQICGSFEYALL